MRRVDQKQNNVVRVAAYWRSTLYHAYKPNRYTSRVTQLCSSARDSAEPSDAASRAVLGTVCTVNGGIT